MAKARIDGRWTDIPMPAHLYSSDVDFSQSTASLDAIRARCSTIISDISEISAKIAPLSATTPSLKRHFYQANSGYAPQGGCTDGTYLYFYIRNSDDSKAGTLVKLRASGGYSTVDTVTTNLGHGGDMTYNPDTGLLYATTSVNEGGRYRIDVIDPATLTKNGSLWNPRNGSRFAYEKSRKMFLIGGTGSNTYYLQQLNDNGEFEHIRSITLSKSPASEIEGRGGQGIACDEAFIYISWSDNPRCIIEVFDWYGTYLGKIEKSITYDGRNAEMEFVDKLGKNEFVIGVYMAGLQNTARIYSFTAT